MALEGNATLFDTLFFGGQFQHPTEQEAAVTAVQPAATPIGTVVISSNLPPLPSVTPGPSPANILTFTNDIKFNEHINVVKKSKLR